MIVTARIMETPSSQPSFMPCDAIPKIKETTAAAHKICMVRSSKFYKIISNNVFGGFTIGALVPNRSDLHPRSELSAVIPL